MLEMEGIQEIKIATIIIIDKADTKTKIITKSITRKKNRLQPPFRMTLSLSHTMIPKPKQIFQAETFKKIEIQTTITEKKETTIETTKITRTKIEKRDIITPAVTTTTFIIKVESMMVLREVANQRVAIIQQKPSKNRTNNK